MDYVHFASFGDASDLASNHASNPCRYSSAVVEQLTCNQQVPSSTLGGGTNFNDYSDLLYRYSGVRESGGNFNFSVLYSIKVDCLGLGSECLNTFFWLQLS